MGCVSSILDLSRESRRISPQKPDKFPNTDVGMFKLCFSENNKPLTIPTYDTIVPDTNHV